MKKFNNRGFALVETLIVSVFVVSLFLIVFSNFYPLMAEYEKRESYDDIDSVYAAYWIKKLVEDKTDVLDARYTFKKDEVLNRILTSDDLCHYFDVNGETDPQEWQKKCYALFKFYDIKYVYLTDYNIKDFKQNVFSALKTYSDHSYVTNDEENNAIKILPKYSMTDSNDKSIDIAGHNISILNTDNVLLDFEDYLKYLPNYSNNKNNTYGSNFRVIIVRRHKVSGVMGTDGYWYNNFANMEGNKVWKN